MTKVIEHLKCELERARYDAHYWRHMDRKLSLGYIEYAHELAQAIIDLERKYGHPKPELPASA